MSTLKVTNLQHPSAASANVTLDASGNADFNGKNLAGVASVNGSQLGGSKNLVINGAMTIAQRGTSTTSVGDGTTGYLTVDRFRFEKAGSPTARYTMTQDSNAPDGFSNSLKLEVTTADTSVGATEHQYIDQFIEAQDLQHLAWDTSSSGKSVTLSFYVKCSTAQTFAVDFVNEDNSRYFNTTYTVSATDTWEKKSINLPADASNGFNNDNGRGLRVRWTLAAGSDLTDGSVSTAWSGTQHTATNHENTWIAATSRTWQLTGVMLEVGDTATSYQHESAGTTLAKCQRYYHEISQYVGAGQYTFTIGAVGGSNTHFCINNPQVMRAAPTITYSGTINMYSASSSVNGPSSFEAYAGTLINRVQWASTGLTSGNASWADIDDAKLTFDAEL